MSLLRFDDARPVMMKAYEMAVRTLPPADDIRIAVEKNVARLREFDARMAKRGLITKIVLRLLIRLRHRTGDQYDWLAEDRT
jgi:hypothetical protein